MKDYVRVVRRIFLEFFRFFFDEENFATIRELAVAVGVSRKRIINTITSFGKGPMRESMNAAIIAVCRYIQDTDIGKKNPPEETFYFLPQVDGVIRLSQTQRPLQLEQATAETIWGMLFIEKKIDFALTAKGLHLTTHHILRIIYKILASTPVKVKFTGNSVDLLEEQDLDALLTALKNETLNWLTQCPVKCYY